MFYISYLQSVLATFMGKDLVVPKIFRTFVLLSRDTLRIS